MMAAPARRSAAGVPLATPSSTPSISDALFSTTAGHSSEVPRYGKVVRCRTGQVYSRRRYEFHRTYMGMLSRFILQHPPTYADM